MIDEQAAGEPPNRIRIARSVLEQVLDHARAALPLECCGLLLGRGDAIVGARAAANELASPVAYRIDPRDYIAAVRAARDGGLDVVGAYHSHPRGAAVPSATDLSQSAGEGFVYVIAGRIADGGDELRAYLLSGGNFTELAVVAVPQEP